MMKYWQLAGWAVVVAIAGGMGMRDGAIALEISPSLQPALDQEKAAIPRLSELQQPATTVKEWMAQLEAATVQVTNVRVERTDAGLDITLETAEGKLLQVDATQFRSEGNSLVAEIPSAVLALPQGQAFVAENPTADIATVQVVQQDGDRIRVSVTGNNALPQTEVTLRTGNLAYSLNPEADEPDVELVVTGERDGYRVPNTSVGTRTDTPLRDIPQTIRVIPQEVLRDQNVTRLEEALRNVPGVTTNTSSLYWANLFNLRGFTADQSNFLRNGLRDPLGIYAGATDFSNVERVEVLSGPASVLYGNAAPGGTINVVTKQPLQDPFYALDATIGNYDFYRGGFDLSGPLNDSKTVLYRLDASYLNRGSFIEFYENEQFTVSPTVSFAIGQRTLLTLEGQYADSSSVPYFGIPAVGTVLPNPNGPISRNRLATDPDARLDSVFGRLGYRLEHQFSDNWSLQSAFKVGLFSEEANERYFIRTSLNPDNRTLEGVNSTSSANTETYDLTTDLIGEFSTGSIDHQLVFGLSLSRLSLRGQGRFGNAEPLDLFDPNYGQRGRSESIFVPSQNFLNTRGSLGIYVQDLVTLTDNLKLLLGGRFDIFEQTDRNFLDGTEQDLSGDAFSPRLGIVYQPIEPISLYASYSRSFSPALGTAFDGSQFQPERGTQYEIGVKADLSERLSATLAFYDLTRSNVLTDDTRPGVPPGFSIQTGEQRSRGVELTAQGEILPGWNIIAGYAYTDARITQDNTLPEGNRLRNIPENAINLWTTYKIQSGDLQGLGFGLGLFFAGERQGDLGNTFQLPSYWRTDAAIFYNRDRFRAALNFRNLFNVDYFDSASSRLRVYPGEPLTVQGTISWEF
ncbi:MAG: TonB-dependent siderophore receptor [Goleter apudmare HA4340-LM2]|nr:TonB-dependent siderophore receptor [Goleter apudmare HA4340-LM2]